MGVPRNEVNAPIGKIVGETRVRDANSDKTKIKAPMNADAGMRNRWSLPTNFRTMWGAMRPMKLMQPTNAVATEAMSEQSTMLVKTSVLTDTPRLRAVSVPLSMAL